MSNFNHLSLELFYNINTYKKSRESRVLSFYSFLTGFRSKNHSVLPTELHLLFVTGKEIDIIGKRKRRT